jgi:hypothetical protein
LLGLLVLVVGFSEWQLRTLRADYSHGRLSSDGAIRITELYLPTRERLFHDPGAVIATAFQVARLPGERDFVASMRQAGIGFGMLRRIFFDPATGLEWKNEAAFEALTLLVRMPWDEDLSKEASRLAVHLQDTLAQTPSATRDEQLMIEELLDLVAIRHGTHTKPAVVIFTSLEGKHETWQVGLHTVRLGLASCLATPEPALDAAWAALGRGFGQGWLRREWTSSWDSGLLQTVQASRISADCQSLAARVQSMAAVGSLSLQ